MWFCLMMILKVTKKQFQKKHRPPPSSLSLLGLKSFMSIELEINLKLTFQACIGLILRHFKLKWVLIFFRDFIPLSHWGHSEHVPERLPRFHPVFSPHLLFAMLWGLATTKKSKKILALFPMKSCIFNVFSSMKSYVFNVVNSRWLLQDTA